MLKTALVLMAVTCSATFATAPSLAAEGAWPNKPVKLIVGVAPGGGTDFLARAVAEKLQAVLGQPVIVDNKTGVGGLIAATTVSKAPADGYTFLVTANSFALRSLFVKQATYDPVKDFSPVSIMATSPLMMVVHAESPAKTAADFMKLAKSRPQSISYGSPGIGTPQHLVVEMLAATTGTEMLHVPYKGAGPVVNALFTKEIEMTIGAVGAILPHVKSGKLRALAVSSATRSELLPGLPTISEALSQKDLSVDLWYGILGPAGTPKPIADRMSAEIAKIVRDPAMKALLAPQGVEAVGSTPQQMLEVIKGDIVKYAAAAKAANIQPE